MSQQTWRVLRRNRMGLVGAIVIAVFSFVGIAGPSIVPYQPLERQYDEAGKLKRLNPPSAEHWLGTTLYGRDVLSQLVVGTRNAFLIGLLTAFFVAMIGLNVGLITGYYGGWVTTF